MSRLVTPPRRHLPFREKLDAIVEQGFLERNIADLILRHHQEEVDFAVKGGRIALAAEIRHGLQDIIDKEGI